MSSTSVVDELDPADSPDEYALGVSPEPEHDGSFLKVPAPEFTFFYSLTLSFLNPLLARVASSGVPLELQDLPPLDPAMNPPTCARILQSELTAAEARVAEEARTRRTAAAPSADPDSRSLLSSEEREENSAARTQKEAEEDGEARVPPSFLFFSLFSTARTDFVWNCLFSVLNLASALALPFILALLLGSLEDLADAVLQAPEAPSLVSSMSKCLGFSLLGFLALTGKAIGGQHSWIRSQRAEAQASNALMGMLYNRIVRIGSIEKGSATSLVTVDIPQLTSLLYWVPNLVRSLVLIALCIVELCALLGWSGLVSLAVIAVALPCNWYFGYKYDSANDARMGFQDKRLGSLTQGLSGILSIKVLCLENWFSGRVTDIRASEEASLRRMNWAMAGCYFTASAVGTVMIMVTLLTYSFVSDVGLQPTIVFPALVVFDMITWPLFEVAYSAGQCLQAFVSLRRLSIALFQSKLLKKQRRLSRRRAGDIHIKMKLCTFQWPQKLCLPSEEEEKEEKEEKE
ncbi:MAG: ABC transporter transmembrane domain-containing protein, partial [archaeon]|nr:ABC transporter transmembrane domain-containing protein [archaeon]